MKNSRNKQGAGHSLDKLLSIDETCVYLGVSRATVYRLIRQGKIKTYRILTRSSRIRLTELDDFIAGTLERSDTPTSPSSGVNSAPETNGANVSGCLCEAQNG